MFTKKIIYFLAKETESKMWVLKCEVRLWTRHFNVFMHNTVSTYVCYKSRLKFESSRQTHWFNNKNLQKGKTREWPVIVAVWIVQNWCITSYITSCKYNSILCPDTDLSSLSQQVPITLSLFKLRETLYTSEGGQRGRCLGVQGKVCVLWWGSYFHRLPSLF